ncbi:toprim domain-containing protein [Sphingobium sp. SA2]|uniref:DUF7146 domain-containing protein n=1 Tax=Sphingobium sp. SA2 TaxID=1524832 RepID=UPI0028C2464A|nr:toprim domain-containing protein [Sphingobium sp. SA2]MDT7535379.1 toprim domain-containing protein [Sphingobium sp. SA2]
MPLIQAKPHYRPTPALLPSERISEVRAIWRLGIPVSRTLAEIYLASRGLNLTKPDILRFAYLPCGGVKRPAMIAPVLSCADDLIGVQRTFLAPDGRGKAAIPKPKLSLGRIAGGAIRCAQRDDALIVTEGLEDALSAMQIFGMPAWAAAGGGMMAKMVLPDHIRSVVIGADNDEAGNRAAMKAAEVFSHQGRQVRIVRPADRFKDFNAELMETRNG